MIIRCQRRLHDTPPCQMGLVETRMLDRSMFDSEARWSIWNPPCPFGLVKRLPKLTGNDCGPPTGTEPTMNTDVADFKQAPSFSKQSTYHRTDVLQESVAPSNCHVCRSLSHGESQASGCRRAPGPWTVEAHELLEGGMRSNLVPTSL